MADPYEQTGLWRRTLAERQDDPDEQSRARLRESFKQFRRNVTRIAAEIPQSMPQFTDHSIEHIDALWDTATTIIGDETPMNPLEAFVLGGSFLLHDLGMGLAAFGADSATLTQSIEFKDIRAFLASKKHDIDEQELDEEALSLLLRNHHAERAETIISERFRFSSSDETYLLEDAALRHHFGQIIGRIAHSHWFDVSELPREFEVNLGPIESMPSDWACDSLKIACILRLADAGQIDSRRAPGLTHGLRSLGVVSKKHWEFQTWLHRPQRDGDRLVYTSSKPFDPPRAGAWWLAYDTIQMIDGELRKVDAMCSDHNRTRFPVRSVAGASSPSSLARFIPVRNWTPFDSSLKATDVPAIVTSVGGEALYGHDKWVPLRELISNAADATRALAHAIGEPNGSVKIMLSEQEGLWYLTVSDCGIGMRAEDLAHRLTDFGTSFWKSSLMTTEHPGLLSSDFDATGRFGIGFFSVFMISDKVEVRSLKHGESSRSTSVLEFTDGVRARPILRPAEQHELLSVGGTVVKLTLKDDPRSNEGLLGVDVSQHTTDVLMRQEIRSTCALVDVDIYLKGPTEDGYSLVVAGNSWKSVDNGTLFDSLYADQLECSEPLTREMMHAYRNVFSAHAEQILDDAGHLVGRAMLAAGLDEMVSMDMWWWPLPRGQVYVGGMKTDTVYNTLGAFVGAPLKADRQSAFPVAKPEILREWANRQGLLNLTSTFATPTTRYGAGQLVLAVGGRIPELPIAMKRDGFLALHQLASWISDRDEFFIVQEYEVFVFADQLGSIKFVDRVKGTDLDWPDSTLVVDLFPNWIFPPEVQERPLDERFKAHRSLTAEWDAGHFWYRDGATGAMHEILEAAALAWNADVVDLGLRSQRMVYSTGQQDLRLLVPALDPSEPGTRIDALRISRPQRSSLT